MNTYNNSFVFQDSTTNINTGTAFRPNRTEQVTIYITGTSNTRTINFEGSDDEGNWFPVLASKIPDLSTGTSTTGTNEVWSIDVSNWVSIRTNVVAISGGTVRITGKLISIN